MKSKTRRRVIAFVLCMVMLLSCGVTTLAEGNTAEPAVTDEAATQDEAAAAVQSETEEETATVSDSQTSMAAAEPETTVEETAPAEASVQAEPAAEDATVPAETTSAPAEETTESTQEAAESDVAVQSEEPAVTEESAEAETETAESTETEKETAAFQASYTLEDGSATITASAEEGVFPEGTTLKAERITEESDQYDSVEESLAAEAEKDNKDLLDFVAFDIAFFDEAGNEIEPNGEVNVSIQFEEKEVFDSLESADDLSLVHIKEDSVVENVEANIDTDASTIKNVDFISSAFSVYAITKNGISETFSGVIPADSYGTVEFWHRIDGNIEIKFSTDKPTDKQYIYQTFITIYVDDTEKKEIKGWLYTDIDKDLNTQEKDSDISVSVKPGDGYWFKDQCKWKKGKNDNNPTRFTGSGPTGVDNPGDDNQYYLDIYLTNKSPQKADTQITDGTKAISVDLYNYNEDEYNNYVIDTLKGGYTGSLLLRSPWNTTYKANHYKVPKNDREENGHNNTCGDNGIYYGLAHMSRGNAEEGDYENYNIDFRDLEAAFFDDAFDTAVQRGANIGTKYQDVNFMFSYDKNTNTYSYDSGDENSNDEIKDTHVHFDEVSNTIWQYEGEGPGTASDGSDLQKNGFFPFTDETDNMTDYGFGMRMDVEFLLTADGRYQGEDMEFSFSGDDDVWVFVDGEIVLDLGGLHGRRGGTINFANGGSVTYDEGKTGSVNGVDGTQQPSYNFENLEPGMHTLTFYYLERGGDASNCKIVFNLPVVTQTGNLSFEKVDSKTGVGISGVEFGLYDTNQITSDTQPLATAVSDEEGNVTFDISELDVTQTYYLKEISTPFGYQTNETVYTVELKENSDGSGTVITKTGKIKYEKEELKEIENTPVQNTGGTTNVTVTKEWENRVPEVPVEVTLYEDGKIVPNTPQVTLNSDNNWTYTWDNLPGDVTYAVEETVPEGYKADPTEYTYDFKINDPYERVSPCSFLSRELGTNGVVAIKKGNNYFIWTTGELQSTEQESLREAIGELAKNGFEENNTTFGDGTGSFTVLDGTFKFEYLDNNLNLTIDATSAWSWFMLGTYTKTVNAVITNNIDETDTIDIPITKIWKDSGTNRPESITLQLYKKIGDTGEWTEVSDKTLVLNKSNQSETDVNKWEGEFLNLPYWDLDTKQPIQYKVEETKIGDTAVSNNMAAGYTVKVTGDESTGFTITNSKSWNIVKVSKTDSNITLPDAKFKLQKEGESPIYGKSNTGGKIEWFSDQECLISKDISDLNGEYILTEMTAPTGYSKNTASWEITFTNGIPTSIISSDKSEGNKGAITPANVSNVDTYYYKNEALFSLPESGGSGIYWYMLGGVLLMMAGSLLVYKKRRGEVLRRK